MYVWWIYPKYGFHCEQVEDQAAAGRLIRHVSGRSEGHYYPARYYGTVDSDNRADLIPIFALHFVGDPDEPEKMMIQVHGGADAQS